jgi:PKD repeat protein
VFDDTYLKEIPVKQILSVLALVFLTSCSLVSTLIDEGEPPIIKDLSVSPENGVAPLLSTVRWNIINLSDTPVTCTLEFGNGGLETVDNCAEKSNFFYTYERAGGYILTLTAVTGKHKVSKTFPVTVQSKADTGTAVIKNLTVTPNNGTAPMLSAINWQLEGFTDPVTCVLTFGDGKEQTIEKCSQVNDTFHTYEKAGGYILVLTVKDTSAEVSRSLPVTVQTATQ